MSGGGGGKSGRERERESNATLVARESVLVCLVAVVSGAAGSAVGEV